MGNTSPQSWETRSAETLDAPNPLEGLFEYSPPIRLRLESEDADFLKSRLGFALSGPWEDDWYQVEVGPHVCRAVLPISKQKVSVQPKIPAKNVLEMLGTAYGLYTQKHGDPFEDFPEVGYEHAPELFETLVRHFLSRLEEKIQSGLISDYVDYERNLRTIRGKIALHPHIQNNIVRPDRIFCRFTEFSRDILENQVLLWTLLCIGEVADWTTETMRRIWAATKEMHGVSVTPFRKRQFPIFHYHRLNEPYRELHSWSKLFLDMTSFSDKPGDFSFRGFVLNMNNLFENFVTQAFLDNVQSYGLEVQPRNYLFEDRAVQIKPDLVLLENGRPIAVVDAKYKRIDDQNFKNFDVYQVVTYATVLGVDSAFLIYPLQETEESWTGRVTSSPISVSVQTVDFAQPDVSLRHQANELVMAILNRLEKSR